MAAAPPSAFMTSALPSGVEGAVQQCPWWIGVFMTAVPLVDRRVNGFKFRIEAFLENMTKLLYWAKRK